MKWLLTLAVLILIAFSGCTASDTNWETASMEKGIDCDIITEHLTYSIHFRIYDQHPNQQLVIHRANPTDYMRSWSNIPHVEVYVNICHHLKVQPVRFTYDV